MLFYRLICTGYSYAATSYLACSLPLGIYNEQRGAPGNQAGYKFPGGTLPFRNSCTNKRFLMYKFTIFFSHCGVFSALVCVPNRIRRPRWVYPRIETNIMMLMREDTHHGIFKSLIKLIGVTVSTSFSIVLRCNNEK